MCLSNTCSIIIEEGVMSLNTDTVLSPIFGTTRFFSLYDALCMYYNALSIPL